ncbi:MAG TPA: hypothetical protein PKN02_11150, partial [Thermotogota bacterium]|nr:hypothetical protein [Thermotogota bacterium]
MYIDQVEAEPYIRLHIDQNKAEQYVKSLILNDFTGWSIEEVTNIESHLDACDTCAQFLHEEYHFLQTLLRWNIQMDNALIIQKRIRESLEAASVKCADEKRKRRFQRWLALIPMIPETVLKVCHKVQKHGTRLLSQITPVETGNASPSSKKFSYEMLLEPVRGTEQSTLCPNLTRVIAQDGSEMTTIRLNETTGVLEIAIEDYGQEEPNYCLLIPMADDPEVRLQEKGYARDGGYFRYT